MIHIKALVEGETDTLPFTRIFELRDNIDEKIFFESVKTIKRKLSRNLRINTNECLIIFCDYIINEILAKRTVSLIEKNASKLLSEQQVMIGVSETLRKITFEVFVDNTTKKNIIIIENALPKSNYLLV
jgi:urease gamma subunit